MNIKKFVTLAVAALVALLVGAAIPYFTIKRIFVPVPFTADGSPITVSGDTIHFLHKEIRITGQYTAIAHHHNNEPVSLTMYGCSQPNCSMVLMPKWSAKLSGGTADITGQIPNPTDVADFTDVPGFWDNTVTIQVNTYPLVMNPPYGVDYGGKNFYFSAIAVTPSGGQPTNLSCAVPGPTCSIVMAYCPVGHHPVVGSAQYCQP